jgi:hypothetical protein
VAAEPLAACATVARYRFHVVAPSVVDAVTSAGGLICDRAMAGWQVTVLVAGPVDDRAIQILGAAAASLRTPSQGPAPQMLAVASELIIGNRSVRDLVCDALDGATDLLLWGRRPPGLNCTFNPVGHRPSAAAQAFKAHALAAQRTCHPADMTDERFFSTNSSARWAC